MDSILTIFCRKGSPTISWISFSTVDPDSYPQSHSSVALLKSTPLLHSFLAIIFSEKVERILSNFFGEKFFPTLQKNIYCREGQTSTHSLAFDGPHYGLSPVSWMMATTLSKRALWNIHVCQLPLSALTHAEKPCGTVLS